MTQGAPTVPVLLPSSLPAHEQKEKGQKTEQEIEYEQQVPDEGTFRDVLDTLTPSEVEFAALAALMPLEPASPLPVPQSIPYGVISARKVRATRSCGERQPVQQTPNAPVTYRCRQCRAPVAAAAEPLHLQNSESSAFKRVLQCHNAFVTPWHSTTTKVQARFEALQNRWLRCFLCGCCGTFACL